MSTQLPTWARGDLEPPLTIACLGSVGGAVEGPVDFTAATAVRVLVAPYAQRAGAPTVVDADPDRTEQSGGLIAHRWASGETDTPGLYRAEVEATWPGGRPQTFGPVLFEIVHDIA